jgi:carbamoyl-phosphate synthase large subunit
MDNKITVIVTGGGAPGAAGTIFALRNNPDNAQFRIITTDINDGVVGKYLADGFYKLPPPENENYIPSLQSLVRRENARAIIPQTTREIEVLSANADKFADYGVAVVVSSASSIAVANDKYLLLEKAQQIAVPCPRYYLADSADSLAHVAIMLGYPEKKIVVKPRVSNGMRGLRILTEQTCDVRKFLSEKPDGTEITLDDLLEILRKGDWPELLVTEYLPGNEYTVDVFRGKNGIVVIPRLREKIRSGITFDAKVELRGDIAEYSRKLAEALDLKYAFGFQFKLSGDETPMLLECNPRIQGTMVTSVFAGFNLIYYSVLEAMGIPALCNPNIEDGVEFKRYWGGIAINKNGLVEKI